MQTHRFLPALALLLLAAAGPATASSADRVLVSGERQREDLGAAMRHVEDPGRRIDFATVVANPDVLPWPAPGGRTLRVGTSGARWWLRADLHNLDDVARERVVVIDLPTLDDVHFALLCPGQPAQRATSGDTRPFSTRALPDRHPAFPLVLPPRADCTALFSVTSADSLQFPARLLDPATFDSLQRRDNLLRGLGLGMQLLIAGLALIVALMGREATAARFALAVASQAALVLVLTDLGYEFIWGEYPRLQKALAPVAISFTWWSTAAFCLRTLPASTLMPVTRLLLQASWLLAFGVALVQVLAPGTHPMALLVAIVAVGMLLLLAQVGATLMVGAQGAAWAAAGITSIAVASVVEAAAFIGVGLPAFPYLVPLHAGMLGGAVLFGLALLRPERRALQAASTPLDREVNRRVAERTRELAYTVAQLTSANRELDRLSSTDPLTGAYNRRFMDNCLARAGREAAATPLSLILFDIDHFKQVNDQHGHPAGDVCLRTVADCVQQLLRGRNDLLCRYGGEEFAVILPGTPLAGAKAVAEKIRQAVAALDLRCSDGRRLRVTVSLGIGTLDAPGDASRLVHGADDALYRAKRDGRNRWRVQQHAA